MAPSSLFDDRIASRFSDYHFMLRGWTCREGHLQSRLDAFIESITGNRSLQTKRIKIRENVAFVWLKTSGTGRGSEERTLERLCWCITDPDNRSHVNELTTRSLLGISPSPSLSGSHLQKCWREALFRRALEQGPGYLGRIDLKNDGNVPDWAIVLPFAMIVGINVGGHELTASSQRHNFPVGGGKTIGSRVAKLFSPRGVAKGTRFLRALAATSEVEDDQSLEDIREDYGGALDEVERELEAILDQLKELRKARRVKTDLERCCDQVTSQCYSVTRRAALAMLANEDVLQAYLEAVPAEGAGVSLEDGIGAMACVAGAASACKVAAAPLSFQAIGTFLATGGWPAVTVVANPLVLVASLAGLALVGLSISQKSAGKADILRHRALTVLISQAYAAVNEASLFLRCMYYLDSHKKDATPQAFLEGVGEESILESWKEFARRDKKKRDRKKRERAKQKKRQKSKGPRPKSDLSSVQRQVSRYVKESLKEKRHELKVCLAQLRNSDEIDPSEPSDSESSDDD